MSSHGNPRSQEETAAPEENVLSEIGVQVVAGIPEVFRDNKHSETKVSFSFDIFFSSPMSPTQVKRDLATAFEGDSINHEDAPPSKKTIREKIGEQRFSGVSEAGFKSEKVEKITPPGITGTYKVRSDWSTYFTTNVSNPDKTKSRIRF